MLHPAVQLTSELVKINSENPINSEKAVTDFISRWLKEAGISFQLQQVEADRNNIIAHLPGRGDREPLVMIAHCDTVPAGTGWKHDPFGGEILDGKLYGRGSADMKSGLAATLYALKEASKQSELPGDLVVVVSVDEEGPGMKGVMKFLESNLIDETTMTVAPEPTSLEIVRDHRGVMWYELETFGKAAHGGHAEQGIDANHAMAEIISELKTVVSGFPFQHPLLKKTLLSVGNMQGGAKTNVVPDYARAEIDFRIVPPLDADDADQMVENAVRRALTRVPGATAEIKNLGLRRPPVEVPENAEVIHLVEKVMNKKPVQSGYVAYTDAAAITWKLGNKNAICFGPGNLEQAHTIDEWVNITEIEQCAEIFKVLAIENF